MSQVYSCQNNWLRLNHLAPATRFLLILVDLLCLDRYEIDYISADLLKTLGWETADRWGSVLLLK